jgi:hypothetical protein
MKAVFRPQSSPEWPFRLVRAALRGNNVRMPRRPAISALLASLAATAAGATDLLLIPDTQQDKVWAFSAFDGSVVSQDYIPFDGNMRQVRSIAQLPNGNLVMADPATALGCSTSDGLLEYSPCGNFIRRIAGEAEGACDPQQAYWFGGKVWFSKSDTTLNSAGGLNSLWSMNADGTGLMEVARPSLFVRTWGFAPIADGFVVASGGSSSTLPSSLVKVSFDGTTASVWHQPDEAGLKFPQQVSPMPGGGVAVACFSGNYGVYFFDANGQPRTDIPSYHRTLGPTFAGISPRGCYPLGNGEVLYAGGTAVGAFNPVTGDDRPIVNSVSGTVAQSSFHWITKIRVCPSDLTGDGQVDGQDLGVLLGNWGGSSPTGDLNCDLVIDGQDLGVLLGNWGNCGTP